MIENEEIRWKELRWNCILRLHFTRVIISEFRNSYFSFSILGFVNTYADVHRYFVASYPSRSGVQPMPLSRALDGLKLGTKIDRKRNGTEIAPSNVCFCSTDRSFNAHLTFF